MDKTEQRVVMGSHTVASIQFESVSGQTLRQRWTQLHRYYRGNAQPAQRIAEEFKKSLIKTIENGTIIVNIDGEKGLA